MHTTRPMRAAMFATGALALALALGACAGGHGTSEPVPADDGGSSTGATAKPADATLADGWYKSVLAHSDPTAGRNTYVDSVAVTGDGSAWVIAGKLSSDGGYVGPATWTIPVADDATFYSPNGDVANGRSPYTRAEFEDVIATPDIGLGFAFRVRDGKIVEAYVQS